MIMMGMDAKETKLNNMETQYIKKDNGHTYYYADEDMTILHRLDRPAVEYADADKEWWVDGKIHRTDGPAMEYTDGYKAWWVENKRHRLDGPAVEYADGDKEWWVDGKCLTEAEFNMMHVPIINRPISDKGLDAMHCSALILARDVLQEVEWKGNEKESRCIVCYGHCSKGHEPECSLARAAWNLGVIIQQNTPAQDNNNQNETE